MSFKETTPMTRETMVMVNMVIIVYLMEQKGVQKKIIVVTKRNTNYEKISKLYYNHQSLLPQFYYHSKSKKKMLIKFYTKIYKIYTIWKKNKNSRRCNSRVTSLVGYNLKITIISYLMVERLHCKQLVIKTQSMSICKKRGSGPVNGGQGHYAIIMKFGNFIRSKPSCLRFSQKILKSQVIQQCPVTFLK